LRPNVPMAVPTRSKTPLVRGTFALSAPVSKTVVGGFVHRGFESHPLRFSVAERHQVRQRPRSGPTSKPLGSRCAEVNAGQRESAEAVGGFRSPGVPPERRGLIDAADVLGHGPLGPRSICRTGARCDCARLRRLMVGMRREHSAPRRPRGDCSRPRGVTAQRRWTCSLLVRCERLLEARPTTAFLGRRRCRSLVGRRVGGAPVITDRFGAEDVPPARRAGA
jgi:hypothetical protein